MTKDELMEVFERLRNIMQTLTTSGLHANKTMVEALIQDTINRLEAANDSSCERVIDQLRTAAASLRARGDVNADEVKEQIRTASRGLVDLINRRFDHVDDELDHIRNQQDDTQDQIDDWGGRIIAALGGGNPVCAIIFALLSLVLGTGIGIKVAKATGTITQYLYNETGAIVTKNGKAVEVPVYGTLQTTLIGIAVGVMAALLVWAVYRIICHIVNSFRARR